MMLKVNMMIPNMAKVGSGNRDDGLRYVVVDGVGEFIEK